MKYKIKLKREFRRFKEIHYSKLFKEYLELIILIIISIFIYNYILTPQIILSGRKRVYINYKDEYKDPGYKASILGKDISKSVIVKGGVNTNKLGTYKIIYSVRGKSVTRKIYVMDLEPPKIHTNKKEVYVCPGGSIKPKRYKVTDNYDGNISSRLKYDIKKNYITYYVSDSNSNKTIIRKNIIYKDKTPPKIVLNGDSYIYLHVGDNYIDPKYTVNDNCDSKVHVRSISKLNMKTPGIYKIKYIATDKYNNKSSTYRHVVVSNPLKIGGIYLTFDDGPRMGTTDVILDILKEEGVHGTFFVTSSGEDALIKREYLEGHSIGLHTSSHNYSIVYASKKAYFSDLDTVSKRVLSITGSRSYIIRFPGGSSNTVSRKYTPNIMSYLTKEVINRGYKYYDWNINSMDAEGGVHTSTEIKNNVISSLRHDHANVVLLHDIKPTTRDALRDIIKYGKENGYSFEVINKDSDMVRQRINN